MQAEGPHLVQAGDLVLDDGPLVVINLKGHPQGCQRREDVTAQETISVSMTFSSQALPAPIKDLPYRQW